MRDRRPRDRRPRARRRLPRRPARARGRDLRGRARASASACSAPTAAARRRCSARCSASSRRAPGRSTVHGPRGDRAADRALAAGLPGVRARRRADGRARAAAVVAAPGPRRARRARWPRSTASAWPTAPTTTFGELSGGQRQRVLVARALLQDAAILLLDEPFTGLDAPSAERLTTLIDELAAEGRCVLVATHDVDQARAWDHVLCLNRRQIAFGPPAEVLTADVLERDLRHAIVRLPTEAAARRRRRTAGAHPCLTRSSTRGASRSCATRCSRSCFVGLACGALGVLGRAARPRLQRRVARARDVPRPRDRRAAGRAARARRGGRARRRRGRRSRRRAAARRSARDNAVAVVITTLLGLGALLALSADSPPGPAEPAVRRRAGHEPGDLALAGRPGRRSR